MMSLVDVWNGNEESPTKSDRIKETHHYSLHQMQLDTMQDIISEEDTVRYVRLKSEESGSAGNNNNNNNGINSSPSSSSNGNNLPMDKDEKRMRREIANSNERRRMQSINAGFQSLRQMLPHHEGEKLSKAAILQQTAEYIYSLEQEKTRLLSQNCQLKRTIDQQDHNGAPELGVQNATQIVTGSSANGGVVVSQQQQQQLVSNAGTGNGGSGQPGTVVATVAKKRKIDVTTQPVSDSSDEGLGSMSPEPVSLRAVNVTSNGSNLSNAHSGTTTISSPSTHGRQCTTVNFSAKDVLELKHQLEVERRQKLLIENRLKALERQLYPTRIQYQDTSELVVPDLTNEPSSVSLASEEVAVSIIHKPVSSVTTVSGKPTRVPTAELDGGMLLISQDANSLAKNQHIVVCSNELIEEPHTMQTVPAVPKQLAVPLKDEKLYIKRSRSRSPTIGEATVVTLPPKKNRYPSILEAAIKAEPKVEVERIDSPSSIVVNDDQMMVSTTGSHLVGTGTSLSAVQQPRLNCSYRHNLETIVEAIRHLEGDAFDAVVPTQQQQQQQQQQHQHQQQSLHQPLQQPQPVPPPTVTPQTTIQQRPMQEVPLALTTASKQQIPLIQTKTDRDHRQIQLEPYLRFRTAPNASASAVLPTASAANLAATASSVVTVTPQVGSIISVSIAPTGSNPLPVSSSCHSPAASAVAAAAISSTAATTTIVANSSVVSANLPLVQQQNALTTAAQLLQQQQQCRPGVIVVKQNS
ncbi:dual specificity protein kinase splA [Anopheles maculipalpis]|uniref:dual specificity protein kinase splA n=1 Tax=Anopheles maculipalpis TaxID=1496333 RepID=UPI0021599679|nr:dual specificity protein kinase splA [Anopheles maculipalpis]